MCSLLLGREGTVGGMTLGNNAFCAAAIPVKWRPNRDDVTQRDSCRDGA